MKTYHKLPLLSYGPSYKQKGLHPRGFITALEKALRNKLWHCWLVNPIHFNTSERGGFIRGAYRIYVFVYKNGGDLWEAVYVTRHFVACVQTPLPSGKIVSSGGEGGSVHRPDTLVKYCVKFLGSLLEFVYYFRRSISENLIHFFRTVLVPDRHHPSTVFTTEPPRKLRATERFRVTVSCWTRCSTFDCLPCSCWLFHISSKIPSK